jgi:glucosamine--fructose-6-phosphate aminotransferase (isomerizing)
LGRYAAELATGRPAALAAPSLITRYRPPHDCGGVLAVALSQSGRTPEIDAALRAMRAAGARTVAITNETSSPLAVGADLVLALDAGEERAVPATKTVTAQLLSVLAIAAALGPLPVDAQDLVALPGQIYTVLNDPAPARSLAQRWAEQPTLLAVARGFLLAAALETALKIRETAAITAVGTSSADLVHGPVAAVRPGAAVLMLDGDPATVADVSELRRRLSAIGADVATMAPGAGSALTIPTARAALLAPILATVRGQQLALELALARGRNPDAPAGLSKVTAST